MKTTAISKEKYIQMKKSENEELKEKLDEIIRKNAERKKSLEKILRELNKNQEQKTIKP